MKQKIAKPEHIKQKGTKQIEFQTSEFKKSSREFGGVLLKSRRKTARPLSTSKALHLVLRVSEALRVSDVSLSATDTRGSLRCVKDTIEVTKEKDTVDVTKETASNNRTVSLRRTGSVSLRKHKNSISSMLDKYSQKFGVKIYKYAIAGNHIHIVLRCTHRLQYRGWIRSLTGQLAVKFKIKWGHRPWSRILTWGKEFLTVTKYVLQNILEADGVIAYQPRKYRRS